MSDKICALICSVWSLTLSEDGVANGDSVWQWNQDCSEGGVAKVTWCGYFYNGGGAPHFAMQFGLNGKVSLLGISYAHGMRRWIDDDGSASTFSKW